MGHSLQAAVKSAADILSAAGIDNARREASLLVATALKAEINIVHLQPERLLSASEYQAFTALVARRERREPMSHILGHREFWSLEFLVGADVLDPRPDSETVIEVALQAVRDGLKVRRILDLGTGSGCLLLTLLSEIAGVVGTGIDVSEAALDVARQNAAKLEIEGAVFQQGRWCDGLNESFDLVVSNPPYIPSGEISDLQLEVRGYEPHLALDGGPDGLNCYRQILADIHRVLRPGGLLIFELGIGQASSVVDLMEKAGLIYISRHRDLAAIDRVVSAIKAE